MSRRVITGRARAVSEPEVEKPKAEKKKVKKQTKQEES